VKLKKKYQLVARYDDHIVVIDKDGNPIAMDKDGHILYPLH